MKIIRPVTISTSVLISSTIAENDYSEWDPGTTYALGYRTIKASTHKVYESLQAGNIGHDPLSEGVTPIHWLEVGSTNRWRMFDASPSLQTSASNNISVVLAPGERINSLAMMNMSAAYAHVVMTDPIEGVVYDKTYSLVSDSGVQDWYAYFFEPIRRKSDVAFCDLPPYSTAQLAISLTDSGNTVAIGECVIGMFRELGNTRCGTQLRILDYSTKTKDTWGNYTIKERAFSRGGTFPLLLSRSQISEVHSVLASYRATPIVYIASEDIDVAIIYGYYKDFTIEIAYQEVSLCSLEIEGLT